MFDQHRDFPLSRRDLLVGVGASAVATLATPAFGAEKKPKSRAAGFDVEDFVESCKRASIESDSQAAVQEVLAREISDPRAVLAGLGAPSKGGIQTLYRSPTLSILNIVWAPLMQLMPHEHNMWALIGIYTGREDNIFWRRRDGQVAAIDAAAIAPGRAVPLAKDVIHSVANPIEKLTGAIHIYGGDFFEVHRSEWDPESLTEREWDIQAAVKLFNQSNDRFFEWQNRTTCR